MVPRRSGIVRGCLAQVQQWSTSARSFQPVRTTTQVTPVPLCGKCYGSGLEFAFPPVAAGEMGGWTASWPHGREEGLVYRQTCRGCHGLGVTEPAANRPLSLQQVEHAEGLVQ